MINHNDVLYVVKFEKYYSQGEAELCKFRLWLYLKGINTTENFSSHLSFMVRVNFWRAPFILKYFL